MKSESSQRPSSSPADPAGLHFLRIKQYRGLGVNLRISDGLSEREVMEGKAGPLSGVVLDAGKPKDLVRTYWPTLFLVSTRFQDVLLQAGMTGWTPAPVAIVGLPEACKLELLCISGKVGPIYGVGAAARPKGESLGQFIDTRTWDGSDLFLAANYNGILVSEACAAVLARARLTNVSLDPAGIEAMPAGWMG